MGSTRSTPSHGGLQSSGGSGSRSHLSEASGTPLKAAGPPPAPGRRSTSGPITARRSLDLTGSLVLTGDRGLGVGFRAKAIGFTDSLTGVQGRSVWTDENGDKVYSELKGEMVGAGFANRITGTFLGGTGRFAGVTGEYSFRWEYVIESDDDAIERGGRQPRGQRASLNRRRRPRRRTLPMNTAATASAIG